MRILHFIWIVLLSGCTANRFYTPNTMQIPMLTGAGQGTVSGIVSRNSGQPGWEAQAVYSPLPHVAVLVNHLDTRYKGNLYTDFFPTYYELNFTGHTRLTEGGLGGYITAGPEKEYLLSAIAGFGQGITKNEYTLMPDLQVNEIYRSDWRYQRWFIQPALGLQYRHFQVGTGLRLVWVNYLDGNVNSRVGLAETERIELLDSSSPLFLAEMAWTIGWRLRPVVISLNSTVVVRGKDKVRQLDLASNFVSLGVGVNIHEMLGR